MGILFVIGGILLLIILFRIGIIIKDRLYPPEKPKPTVTFGKLPEIPFPDTIIDTTHFTYLINTTTGQLPDFPDRATVYQLAEPQANLLALDHINDLLFKLSYVNKPQQVSDELYKWSLATPPFRTITFNTFTMDFDMMSQYLTDPDVLSAANIQDTATAISVAKDFLTQLQSFPDDIDESKTQTSIFAISGTTLNPAISLSKAQIIRIDFFQKDVNKTSLYYPHPPYSTISVFVGSSKDGLQVVEAHYYHKSVTNKNGTYPIKTARQAFDELQKGQAYVASYNGNTQTISLRDIFLGYYISDQPQSYLMPVIIFQGDNGFFAYVNAITDEWISK